MNRPRLYVVAPLYNEAANLPLLFQSFRETAAARGGDFDVSFVLVDDGSSDGTAAIARDLAGTLELAVLVHDKNRGPGHAFGSAFEHLSSRLGPEDIVMTLEGDNTSRPELLEKMLRRLDEGYDVVLASPYMYGGGIVHTRPHRILLSHVANAFVKEFLGAHGLLTVSSFYRLYRGECIIGLQARYGQRVVERAGYESMIELVMKMIYLGVTISEVPMVLDTSLRIGKSKLKLGRTALGYLSLYRHRRRWQRIAASSD